MVAGSGTTLIGVFAIILVLTVALLFVLNRRAVAARGEIARDTRGFFEGKQGVVAGADTSFWGDNATNPVAETTVDPFHAAEEAPLPAPAQAREEPAFTAPATLAVAAASAAALAAGTSRDDTLQLDPVADPIPDPVAAAAASWYTADSNVPTWDEPAPADDRTPATGAIAPEPDALALPAPPNGNGSGNGSGNGGPVLDEAFPLEPTKSATASPSNGSGTAGPFTAAFVATASSGDPVARLLDGLLVGQGDLTQEELRRLELYRPERVLRQCDLVAESLIGRNKGPSLSSPMPARSR